MVSIIVKQTCIDNIMYLIKIIVDLHYEVGKTASIRPFVLLKRIFGILTMAINSQGVLLISKLLFLYKLEYLTSENIYLR